MLLAVAVRLPIPVTDRSAVASSVMSPALVSVRKPVNTLAPVNTVPLSSVTVAFTPFSVRLPKFTTDAAPP